MSDNLYTVPHYAADDAEPVSLSLQRQADAQERIATALETIAENTKPRPIVAMSSEGCYARSPLSATDLVNRLLELER